MSHVNHSSIAQFLKEFTADSHHRVGTLESENYAKYIVSKWKDYKIEKVEIDEIYEMVPTASKVPSSIVVKSSNDTDLYSVEIPELQVRLTRVNGTVFVHWHSF